jgi:hypothetical protein
VPAVSSRRVRPVRARPASPSVRASRPLYAKPRARCPRCPIGLPILHRLPHPHRLRSPLPAAMLSIRQSRVPSVPPCGGCPHRTATCGGSATSRESSALPCCRDSPPPAGRARVDRRAIHPEGAECRSGTLRAPFHSRPRPHARRARTDRTTR